MYGRFSSGTSLAADFLSRFQQKLDEGSLNQNHQIIIVAASLDDSTERIISYLSDRDVPINLPFFQGFNYGSEQLLSRSWLLDPVRTQTTGSADSRRRRPLPDELTAASFTAESAASLISILKRHSAAALRQASTLMAVNNRPAQTADEYSAGR